MSDGAFPPPPPHPRPDETSSPSSISPTASPSPPPPPPPPAGLTPPPGYVAYQNGPAPTGQLKKVGGVAKLAMGLVALAGLAGLVNAFITNSANDNAADLLAGRITSSEFDDAYAPAQLFGTVQSIIGLAAGVLTVIWMYKMANNVRTFGRRTTWSPLFSIFGWVLPPFLFVIPTLVMRELWKASDPDSPAGTEGWKASGDNPLIYVWFVVYGVVPAVIVAATIGSVIDAALNASGDSEVAAEALDASSNFTLISGILTIVAAALWITIVKQFTTRHVALTGES